MTEAALHTLEDMVEGTEHVHTYDLPQSLVDAFIDVFGDVSPVHVDDAHAKARGFERRVAHGAILNGFLSHFVGMVMPGRNALLLSSDIRFQQPTYAGTRILLRAKISQVVPSQRAIVLTVTFEDLERKLIVARGRVQAGVAEGNP